MTDTPEMTEALSQIADLIGMVEEVLVAGARTAALCTRVTIGPNHYWVRIEGEPRDLEQEEMDNAIRIVRSMTKEPEGNWLPPDGDGK